MNKILISFSIILLSLTSCKLSMKGTYNFIYNPKSDMNKGYILVVPGDIEILNKNSAKTYGLASGGSTYTNPPPVIKSKIEIKSDTLTMFKTQYLLKDDTLFYLERLNCQCYFLKSK